MSDPRATLAELLRRLAAQTETAGRRGLLPAGARPVEDIRAAIAKASTLSMREATRQIDEAMAGLAVFQLGLTPSRASAGRGARSGRQRDVAARMTTPSRGGVGAVGAGAGAAGSGLSRTAAASISSEFGTEWDSNMPTGQLAGRLAAADDRPTAASASAAFPSFSSPVSSSTTASPFASGLQKRIGGSRVLSRPPGHLDGGVASPPRPHADVSASSPVQPPPQSNRVSNGARRRGGRETGGPYARRTLSGPSAVTEVHGGGDDASRGDTSVLL